MFCGEGTGKADLVRRCEGLPNVLFMPLQPLSRLSDLLALADVHLLPQRADAADLVMPSKLGGMLASARPVLVTAAPETELAQVVERRAACGKVVPPEDAPAFAAALRDLLANGAERARMGASCRAFAERELEKDAVLGAFQREAMELAGLEMRRAPQ